MSKKEFDSIVHILRQVSVVVPSQQPRLWLNLANVRADVAALPAEVRERLVRGAEDAYCAHIVECWTDYCELDDLWACQPPEDFAPRIAYPGKNSAAGSTGSISVENAGFSLEDHSGKPVTSVRDASDSARKRRVHARILEFQPSSRPGAKLARGPIFILGALGGLLALILGVSQALGVTGVPTIKPASEEPSIVDDSGFDGVDHVSPDSAPLGARSSAPPTEKRSLSASADGRSENGIARMLQEGAGSSSAPSSESARIAPMSTSQVSPTASVSASSKSSNSATPRVDPSSKVESSSESVAP